MTDPTDRLALAETPADVAAVLADAPHLAAAAARWTAARAAVRQSLAQSLPDADVLVLAGLDPADLDAEERARLDAARPDLDAARARHPGLDATVAHVRADAEAFGQAWDAAAAGPQADRATPAPRRAADREPRPAARRAASRWVWRTAALAAVTAFCAVAATVLLRGAGFETVTAQSAQTVTLADGSTAELAAGAVLMVPTGRRDPRQARLRAGDALFRIAHDPARPFAVETPNADVTVLGTVFAVRVEGTGTERVATGVTLLSGTVDLAVRGSDDAVRLAPGQQSTVAALAAPTPPAAADRGDALAWQPDIVARNEPAGALADRLAEAFGVSVTVDAALAAELVSGDFRMVDGPDAAFRTLALTLGSRSEASGSAASAASFRILASESP